MISARETILQAFRSALIAALSVDPGKVIPANDTGPRPTLPYLTVHVTTPGVVVGVDEEVDAVDAAGEPARRSVGQRTATVSVNAYGDGTEAWLECFVLSLTRTHVRAVWDSNGLAVDPFGAPRDLSTWLDTAFEARWLQEFRVQYQQAGPVETLTGLDDVSLTLTLDRHPADPDPMVVVDEELHP